DASPRVCQSQRFPSPVPPFGELPTRPPVAPDGVADAGAGRSVTRASGALEYGPQAVLPLVQEAKPPELLLADQSRLRLRREIEVDPCVGSLHRGCFRCILEQALVRELRDQLEHPEARISRGGLAPHDEALSDEGVEHVERVRREVAPRGADRFDGLPAGAAAKHGETPE